jgi:hypothetical protein
MKDLVGATLPRTAFLRSPDSHSQLTCLEDGEGTGLRVGEGGYPSTTGITVGDTYDLKESSLPWGSSFSEEILDTLSSSVGVFMYEGGASPSGFLREGVEGWTIVMSVLNERRKMRFYYRKVVDGQGWNRSRKLRRQFCRSTRNRCEARL